MEPRKWIALVGDSDIDRWPKALLPDVADATFEVSGHSGATLGEILPAIEKVKSKLHHLGSSRDELIIIVCAGENDIVNGIPQDQIEKSFSQLLRIVFDQKSGTTAQLIFLGPKFEPWMGDDLQSRNAYVKLSKALEKLCITAPDAASIKYLDCLTMFCGETAKKPGALLGGKAVAQDVYFEQDKLHLSNEGYLLWKQVIERNLTAYE